MMNRAGVARILDLTLHNLLTPSPDLCVCGDPTPERDIAEFESTGHVVNYPLAIQSLHFLFNDLSLRLKSAALSEIAGRMASEIDTKLIPTDWVGATTRLGLHDYLLLG
jgi:hypothetical protein